MPNYLSSFLSIIALSLILSSCKDDPEPNVQLPSNLVVAAEADKEEEGLVYVTASATSANFYTFIFEEDGEETYVEDAEGEASFRYQTSGTFPITVRANTTHNKCETRT